MANKREQRLRRKGRHALAAAQRELDDAKPLRPIALAAIRYVNEIYAPNIKEPFSIANRRQDLVEEVRTYQERSASRAAARRAA